MEFVKFKEVVAKQFNAMKGHELFRTDVEKDAMWETYLASFPEGSNPIFRERTEHDCNCCKSFIRAIGNVVAVIDGKIVSIWDGKVADANYQVVADALSALVKSKPIINLFLHTERTAGVDKTYDTNPSSKATVWNHFFVNIPCGKNGEKNFVASGADIGTILSEARALHDVLLRSLNELTDDSVETVLELIAQKSIYRGEEHKHAVVAFKDLKRKFDALPENQKDGFVWLNTKSVPASVAKIRNTAIGTLLTDLSNDVDLDAAVRSFESKVAPMNYKRPTALVTKSMIESAKNKIEELGLTSAMDRRYAVASDISINDVLFADRSARKVMTEGIFDEIALKVPDKKPKNSSKTEEVTIEKFIADILPMASSIELMMENHHTGNLVSLIAPADPTAGKLFNWNNNFTWSYNGEVTDSIKERVKSAGGNVEGDLCCRLAWFNYDDLDFYMKEPNGNTIYFGNKFSSITGGQLDVDMNAGGQRSKTPVENIFYKDKNKMREGVYKLQVNNFNKRETVDVGFEVEMDFMGTVHRFVCERAVGNKETIPVVEFHYSHKEGIRIIESLSNTSIPKEIWGIQTNVYRKVDMIMMSPNFWDGSGSGHGNKHYFFMINGCKNDGSARGFFNEFLRGDLDAHRKVFEIVGSQMKVQGTEQLSGLGFSSTQHNSVLCKVSGSFNRIVKIVF